MAAPLARAVLVALFTSTPLWQAVAQTAGLCAPMPDGKMRIDFDVAPSLVVHDATLDVSFADLGMSNPHGGAADESLFSFARTLDAILVSAGAVTPDMSAEARQGLRRDFLASWIGTFNGGEQVQINPQSAVLMPVDDRSGAEGALDPDRLLDANDPGFGMVPLALFNRVDLAPADWSNCGEYRIVYGKRGAGFEQRFLPIFEAVMPNPAPQRGLAGCMPLLKAWATLSRGDGIDRVANARMLSEIYYDGLRPGSSVQDVSFRPVVDFQHYGGGQFGGQVRGNLFMASPWQLREWLTQIVVDGDTLRLAFVPETIKNNPPAEAYLDDLAVTENGRRLRDANMPRMIEAFLVDYTKHFVGHVQHNLLVERDARFRDRVAEAGKFVVRDPASGTTRPVVEEDSIVLNMLGLGSHGAFDEFQGSAHVSDDIVAGANAGPRFRDLLEHLLRRPETTVRGGGLPMQNVDVLLNRAMAGTCAGCHQTATNDVVKISANGTPLPWPRPATGGFVHVTEDRTLSPALTDHFLPFRRMVLAAALCAPPQPPQVLQAQAAPRNVFEAVLADAPKVAMPMAVDRVQGPMGMLGAVIPELRGEVMGEIAARARAEREAQRAKPGAFVTARRPH